MGQPLTLWRVFWRELAILLALTAFWLAVFSIIAVLALTMPAFLSLAIWGGR